MTERTHPGWLLALGVALLIAIVQMIILVAFAWPPSRTAPRDLPIALVGSPAEVEPVQPALAAAGFDVRDTADERAARAQILDRETYGAILLDSGDPRVLVASAASPAVAQLLSAAVARSSGLDAVPIEDVRPAPADDPRGAGLAASLLPLVITSVAAAVALTVRVGSPLWRVAGAAAFAVVGGLAATGAIQGWLGSIDGDYVANAGVVAATLLAMTLALVGLHAAFGRLGLGLGAATMILLGNPLAGLTTAPELLPEPWGDLGQLLPPGAGGTALRSVAFFDGAGSTIAWIVLTTWIVAALALAGAAGVVRQRPKSS
jgi:hypothetical protein